MTMSGLARPVLPGLAALRLAVPRWDAAGLVVLVLAAVAYLRVPAIGWAVPVTLMVLYLGSCYMQLSRADRLWVAGCCGLALAVELVALWVFGYHNPLVETPQHDPYKYVVESQEVAAAWSRGWFPALSLKGSLPYLGTQNTGYHRVLSTVFLLVGAKPALAIALNALCVMLMPAIAAILCNLLFPVTFTPSSPRLSGVRVASLLCALSLNFAYWSRWVLKDVLLAFVFGVALALLVSFFRTRRVLAGVLFVLCAGFLVILRAYAGLSLFVGAAAYALSGVSLRRAGWVALWAVLGAWLLLYTEHFSVYFNQLEHSLVALIPQDIQTVGDSFRMMMRGMPRLFLGPYAWVMHARGEGLLYGLYPGMWVLYLAVYPLALAGIIRCAREDHRLSVIPLACIAVSSLIFLATYGGEASRQRLWLELLFIVYAGHGAGARNLKRYCIPYYLALGLFMVAQMISLARHG